MKVKSLILVLLFLTFISLFTNPRQILAQTGAGGCDCGQNPFGECNVNCQEYCSGSYSTSGCTEVSTKYNQCSGPNQCPGGTCTGGECGGNTSSCGRGGGVEVCAAGYTEDKACDCCFPATQELTGPTIKWVYYCRKDAACENVDWRDPCGTGGTRIGGRNATFTSCRGWCEEAKCAMYSCTPKCVVTNPYNINVTKASDSSVTVKWKLGNHGTSQQLISGTVKANVDAECKIGFTTGCRPKVTLGKDIVSYTTPNNIVAGKIYYYKVVNMTTASCSAATGTFAYAIPVPAATCSSITLTGSSSMTSGTSSPITATVNGLTNGTVTSISFTSTNSTVNPTSGYSTSLTAGAAGTATITASAILSGSTAVKCTGTKSITVSNAAVSTSWWQAKDGDVTASGDISSTIPTAKYFNIVGLGGFSGIPVYGGSFNLASDQSKISVIKWNANTATTTGRLFDYSYFNNLIPQDVVPTVATDDSLRSQGFMLPNSTYEWFKSSGPLTITSDIDFGTRKVILFVEGGDLNINGKVNLTDNSGFFGSFVNGSINVDPSVTGAPAIEGIYLADNDFNSGLGITPLHVRGSVAAYASSVSSTGFNLDRNLTDNTNPAELFEYAPDQIMLFPDKLGYRRQKWIEVAP